MKTELAHIQKTMAKMASILTGTANALKGEPPELMQHSWHDLPEVAARVVEDRATLVYLALSHGIISRVQACEYLDDMELCDLDGWVKRKEL